MISARIPCTVAKGYDYTVECSNFMASTVELGEGFLQGGP